MKSRTCILLGLILLTHGCGGSGGSNSTPLAPTVAVPAGCSGGAVERVEVSFRGAGQDTGIMIQLFGKTFNQQIAAGQSVIVTEDLVPCNYEIIGQMLGRSLTVGFGRTLPLKNFSGSIRAGVESGSVVVDDGPNPVFGRVEEMCHVDFNVPGGSNAPSPPFNIKIRFRVSNSNAVNGNGIGGGGCG